VRIVGLEALDAMGDGSFRAVFRLDRNLTATEAGAVRDWGQPKFHHQYSAEPLGDDQIVVVADGSATLNGVATGLVAEDVLATIEARTAREQAQAERLKASISALIAEALEPTTVGSVP